MLLDVIIILILQKRTMEMIDVFSNRELSIIIWASLLLIPAFIFKKDVRDSLIHLIKTFFGKKLLTVWCITAFYITISGWFLCKLQLADKSIIKDSVFYFFLVAIPIYMKLSDIETFSVKRSLLSFLKISLFFEFLVTSYSFSMLGELIFIPVLFMVTCIYYVSEKDKRAKDVKKISEIVLTILSLLMVSHCIKSIIEGYKDIPFISFFLPFIYTLILSPFLYLLSILCLYEEIILRFNWLLPKEFKGKAIWLLIKNGKLSKKQLIKYRSHLLRDLYTTISRDEMKKVFKEHRI